jgi:hypothetical protein
MQTKKVYRIVISKPLASFRERAKKLDRLHGGEQLCLAAEILAEILELAEELEVLCVEIKGKLGLRARVE